MKSSKLVKLLAVTLAIVLGGTMVFAASVPPDVKGLDCETAVTKLVEENIVTGDVDGNYYPDKNLSRAEVSTLIAKAVDPKAAEGTARSGFSDMSGYGWAEPFVGLMADKGIAKGYPDGTFKPGANVKVSELAAFVIRACGINDADLGGTWPDNYMKKADEMDLFDAVSGKDQTSGLDPNAPATKGQAAIAVYNALDQIRGGGQVDPVQKDWTFANLSFSSDMKTANGMTVAGDVKIYSYGKAKNYSESMEIPNVNKLEVQSPVKYTGAKTNGFYKMANGRITELLLPADQGFSGRVYGIVTGYYQTTNASGDQVLGIETLSAGREVNWTCQKAITEAQVEAMIAAIPEGSVVEIQTSKGQVKSMTTDQNAFGAKHFEEVSAKDPANPTWTLVLERVKNKDLFKLDKGEEDPYLAYADNAVVYELNDDGDGYDVGTIGSIKKNDFVRCYDITDDDEPEANVIFVKHP